MSRRLVRAPLAVTTYGDVLLNVAQFDITGKTVDRLAVYAKNERGAVFVGVVVSSREAAKMRRELDDTALQASFGVVAERQARARRKASRRK